MEKEMHKPRKAARLCFRSGCNKESDLCADFLTCSDLSHWVVVVLLDFVDLSTYHQKDVCHV